MARPMADSPFEYFLSTLRSEHTRKWYGYCIQKLVGDPDEFLKRAKADPKFAEKLVMDFILKSRSKVSSASVASYTAPVKSFLVFNDVPLNSRRLRGVMPVVRKVGRDRAPTVQEIRKAIEYGDLRMRTVILLMVSSGIRIGAFDYLKRKDVQVLQSGRGLLTVYRDEPEEYKTFVSAEALATLKEYENERERYFEKLTPDSPLISMEILPKRGQHTASASLQRRLYELWKKCGVANRGEFKQAHGFRKFFKSQASRGIVRPETVEALLGHKMSYFKPSIEELEQEYAGAEPFVTISESVQLKAQIATQDQEHDSEWQRTRLELLEQKEKTRELESAIARGQEDLKADITKFVLAQMSAAKQGGTFLVDDKGRVIKKVKG